MSKKPFDKTFESIAIDDLEQASGGRELGTVYQVTAGVGPFSASVGYSPTTGQLYNSVGASYGRAGIDFQRLTVHSDDPQATLNDVHTGMSDSVTFIPGVGGSYSTNESGYQVGVGVGLTAGIGASNTWVRDPITHEQAGQNTTYGIRDQVPVDMLNQGLNEHGEPLAQSQPQTQPQAAPADLQDQTPQDLYGMNSALGSTPTEDVNRSVENYESALPQDGGSDGYE